jgi:hypothetical protein
MFCLWAAIHPLVGGMAEMGRKSNLTDPGPAPEVGSDLAAGDGVVTLRAGDFSFTHSTIAGETVSDILENLEGQVNVAGVGLTASHSSGSGVITVTLTGGAEVTRLELADTDSAFGYIESHRAAASSLGAFPIVNQTPSGLTALANPAAVRIDANGRFVLIATAGHSATSLNNAIVNTLNANQFQAGLVNGRIVVTRDLVGAGPVTAISWEDNDTGLTRVGTSSELPTLVPTLSEWGMILTLVLLLIGWGIVLRRQPAIARSGDAEQVE